ncbi:MAG: HNH endonuclease [Bryobacteraceae bacterium]|nr:HNH endonuclease [Bryobacteraceae bacterium]
MREEHSGYPHQLDHIVSRKHGGAPTEDNLALACVACNRHKGSDIAALNEAGHPVRLFHPRRQTWDEHFRFDRAVLQPLSDAGEATIRILRLNDPWRIAERLALRRFRAT